MKKQDNRLRLYFSAVGLAAVLTVAALLTAVAITANGAQTSPPQAEAPQKPAPATDTPGNAPVPAPVPAEGIDARQPATPTPLHVGVLFDVSISHSEERLKNAKAAVNSYLQSLGDHVGDVVLIPFGDRARLAERAPLSDSKKVQSAVEALRPSERHTDHLGAFTMGMSFVISRATQDGGRAILLMVTDRVVSPPPGTLPQKLSFDEVVALVGLPDLRKRLRVQTWVLDFSGSALEVRADIGAATIVTTPGSRDEATALGRKLAAQSLELPPMLSAAAAPSEAPRAVTTGRQGGGPAWLQILAYFLSGCVSALAFYKGVKQIRAHRMRAAKPNGRPSEARPRIVEQEKKGPSRIYFVSSDEAGCRSRHIDVPSKDMPPQQAWISSASFIVPGVKGRMASLKVTPEGKTLLRTTDAAQAVRINGEALRPNATYELPIGAVLGVGRFEFTVSDEKPAPALGMGRAASHNPDVAGARAVFQR